MQPQYICFNCKTVIGPIYDDFNNCCKCDDYEADVWRMIPATDAEIAEIESYYDTLSDDEKRDQFTPDRIERGKKFLEKLLSSLPANKSVNATAQAAQQAQD